MNQLESLYEIERKRELTGDIKTFLEALQLHGFTQQGELHEVDTYYSRPDVDFMQTVECLRIRERDGFSELTYKPASTSKTSTVEGVTIKPETNLPISPSDVPVARQLLQNLEMVRLVEVNKFRRTFTSVSHPSLIVSIDEIKGVGTFIETEITSSDKSMALKELDAVENLLGTDAFEIVTKPYRDLCMEKGL